MKYEMSFLFRELMDLASRSWAQPSISFINKFLYRMCHITERVGYSHRKKRLPAHVPTFCQENSYLRLKKVGDFYFGLLMEICMGSAGGVASSCCKGLPHQDCYALANRISYTQLIFKWHVIPPVCRDAVMFTIFRY